MVAGVSSHPALPPLSVAVRPVLREVSRRPLRAEFRFDPSLPMLVSVSFDLRRRRVGTWRLRRRRTVTWYVGRELLRRGFYRKSGVGEVQVCPPASGAGDTIRFRLAWKGERMAFDLPASEVEVWLEATYRIVPAEAETDAVDWDAVITDMLSGCKPPGRGRRRTRPWSAGR